MEAATGATAAVSSTTTTTAGSNVASADVLSIFYSLSKARKVKGAAEDLSDERKELGKSYQNVGSLFREGKDYCGIRGKKRQQKCLNKSKNFIITTINTSLNIYVYYINICYM